MSLDCMVLRMPRPCSVPLYTSSTQGALIEPAQLCDPTITAWVCRWRLRATVNLLLLLLLPMMRREPGKPPPLTLPAPAAWRRPPTATVLRPETQALRRQTLSQIYSRSSGSIGTGRPCPVW